MLCCVLWFDDYISPRRALCGHFVWLQPERGQTEKESDQKMHGPRIGKDGVLYILSIQPIWNIWDPSHNWWFCIFLPVRLLFEWCCFIQCDVTGEQINLQHCHLVVILSVDYLMLCVRREFFPLLVNTVRIFPFFQLTASFFLMGFFLQILQIILLQTRPLSETGMRQIFLVIHLFL